MGKHLIYTTFELNLRNGGPSGYLANLKDGLECLHACDYIDFYCSMGVENNKIHASRYVKNLMKKILPSKFTRFLKLRADLNYLERMSDLIQIPPNIEEYVSIHFHSTVELYHFSQKIKNKKLKVKLFLTTHCPELPYIEHVNKFISLFKNIRQRKKFAEKYRQIDIQAFECAETLIFPSVNAVDAYLHDAVFKCILGIKKLEFVFTGCQPLVVSLSKEAYCLKYNLRQNDIVISFIGRHNYVKGYDILIEAAKVILSKYSNVKFMIAGEIGDIPQLEHPNWIELGRILDPGSLLNVADIFVLPNRQTYFDLILLEALSVGTLSLVSNTGGNKDIMQLSAGVIGFDANDINSLVNKIEQLIGFSTLHISELKKMNQAIYENNFTVSKFAKAYLDLIVDINSKV